MIKFFRKIRQNLLSENKFSKYLIYAIGEIILVVIGILIALQINSWNQGVLDKEEAQILLKNLQADIKNDTLQLNKNIKATYLQVQNIDSIASILVNPKQENINRFIELQQNVHDFELFKSSQSSYDEAISSGKINLLKNDSLRKRIITYYRDINSDNNDQVMKKLRDERILPYINDNIYNTKEVGLILFGTKNDLPNLDLQSLSKDKNYFGILVTSKGKLFQITNWKEYLEGANEILNILDKEIKK